MKIKEVRGTRDLLGRLLYLATEMKIDMDMLSSYPLTPVPMSLAHLDGTMTTTPKCKLMHKIEEDELEKAVPSSRDVYVVDAMFFIRTLQNVSHTYRHIAENIMRNICALGKHVHFVADTYPDTWIKDTVHESRGGSGYATTIVQGPHQQRPSNFQNELNNSVFKTSFLRFLASEWTEPRYASIIKDRQIYLALDTDCYMYRCDPDQSDKVTREKVADLTCEHVEADTRMIWHLKYISDICNNVNAIIRSNDTDVLEILLYHAPRIPLHIWMEAGVCANNNRRFIDVTNLSITLGSHVCDALPGLHAFTGCDFTSSFLGKGKVKPYEYMQKSTSFQHAFERLGENVIPEETVIKTLEEFVCKMYGKPKLDNVNGLRYEIFKQKYKPGTKKGILENIKGCDGGSIPPCLPELLQKIKRTNYIANMWKNADRSIPTTMTIENNGWSLTDGKYVLN